VVEAIEPLLLGELRGRDEVERLGDTGEVLPGDAERRHAAEAGSEEDGIELLQERPGAHVPTDLDVGAHLDAEALHELDLLEGDADRLPHHDDAVGRQAARQVSALEHHDLVAELGQFAGAGQASRTRAHDRDAVAARRRGREGHEAPPVEVVGGVALQSPDLDRPGVGTQHAGAFAQLLDGADAAARGTHEVRFEDGDGGAGHVVGADLADEGRHVDRSRAGLDAGGIEAVEAAGRFEPRLAPRERGLQFPEALGQLLGGEPGGVR
jgi:hypothetical protein